MARVPSAITKSPSSAVSSRNQVTAGLWNAAAAHGRTKLATTLQAGWNTVSETTILAGGSFINLGGIPSTAQKKLHDVLGRALHEAHIQWQTNNNNYLLDRWLMSLLQTAAEAPK